MPQLIFNYSHANTSGYKFNITKIGHSNYDNLAYYNKENFSDIEVTRPGTDTDITLLNTKALMTVNGYVYTTSVIGNRLFVPNATKSMLRSKENNIGIINFNNLSEPITKISITADMITPEAPFTLYEKAIITFTNPVNFPILVMSGYLIFENPETFYRVSANAYVLRLDKLNYIEKLYELQRSRDIFTELDIPVSPNNPSMIDASSVRSDITVTRFLTTFNSFLVDLPITNLSVERIYLEHSNVPGNFRTEIEPVLPIMVGYGKLAEYAKKKTTDNKYTVYINDAYYNKYLFSNTSYNNINVYNDHREVGSTYALTEAFFLKMATNI